MLRLLVECVNRHVLDGCVERDLAEYSPHRDSRSMASRNERPSAYPNRRNVLNSVARDRQRSQTDMARSHGDPKARYSVRDRLVRDEYRSNSFTSIRRSHTSTMSETIPGPCT